MPIPEGLPVGTYVANRFQVDSHLGRGSFGITYWATDTERRDRVVLKELFPADMVYRTPGTVPVQVDSRSGDFWPAVCHRFQREGALLQILRGRRGLVAVRGHFADHNSYYIAMDPVAGTPLQQLIAQTGKLPLPAALALGLEVAHTLQDVHGSTFEGNPLLHRDIKPGNILVDEGRLRAALPQWPVAEDEPPFVWLIDFGAARFAYREHSHMASAVFTPPYAPIEQQAASADGRLEGPGTDLHALGVTLFVLITGEVPPPVTLWGATVRREDVRPRLRAAGAPPHVAEALHKVLQPRIEDRFGDAASFAQALHPRSDKRRQPAPQPRPQPPLPPAPPPVPGQSAWTRLLRFLSGPRLAVEASDATTGAPYAPLLLEPPGRWLAVGRDPQQAQLVLPPTADRVSRRHVSLYADASRRFAWVLDHRSSWGTQVNGRTLTPESPERLEPGQEILLGEQVRLKVVLR